MDTTYEEEESCITKTYIINIIIFFISCFNPCKSSQLYSTRNF